MPLALRGASAIVALIAAFSAPAMADTIVGNETSEFLVGKTQPSTIRGKGGNDVIYGDTDEVYKVGNPVLMSVKAGGIGGNGFLDEGNITGAYSISADGRYVAFASSANDLVPGDGNTFNDVFVKDIRTGALVLASRDVADIGANGPSTSPTLSPDGRYVAFVSTATNLVGGDVTGTRHVYLKDLRNKTITRLSTSTTGTIGNSGSFDPVFSPDGKMVAFRSLATNLVAKPTFGAFQLYIRTIAKNETQLVSLNAAGKAGNGDSFRPAFSPDSKKIAFYGYAPDLVAGDTNKTSDVFVKTLGSTAIVRVSLDAAGREYEGDSTQPTFSPDGNRVAFVSNVNDFASTDSNGTADVFVKSLTSGAIRLVSVNPDGSQSGIGSSQPVFSPDGTKIAFTRNSTVIFDPLSFNRPAARLDQGGVYIRDLDTGALTAVDIESQSAGVVDYPNEPRFFPSGTRIAYFRNTIASCGQLAQCRSQIEARTLTDISGSADLLIGGDGNDKLVGGPGSDRLAGGPGSNTSIGGKGNDTFYLGDGTDTVIGGDGTDTADYTDIERPVRVNLRKGTTRIDGIVVTRLSEVENVNGGIGNDSLRGDGSANVLRGGPGNDLLDGALDAPSVIDTADYSWASAGIRLQFSKGRVTGNKSVGTDTFAKSSKGYRIEQVIGSRFGDILDGSGVNLVRMEGGPGNDRIIGGGGKDLSQRVVYRTAKTAVYVNLAKGVGRNRNKANKDVGRRQADPHRHGVGLGLRRHPDRQSAAQRLQRQRRQGPHARRRRI